ncbi:MAG: glycosyltransferase family 4 protein [Acidobacteria bacterium]|nr:glycosyltransferase family 4 protein [Acidobacteriota bacterium]
MRVLHTDFHRGWGGQAARVLMVCRELKDAGHVATIAAPPGELTRRAREAGLPVDDGFTFAPPARALSFLADGRRLRRLVLGGAFDLLHTHGSQDTWVAASLRAVGALPCAFVATRHNTKRVRFNAANRWLYGRAIDHLVLVSDSVRDNFRPFFESGLLTEDRVSVAHSAYREDLFHERVDAAPVRKALGIEGNGPVIGVLARLVEDKGHTHLFRAFREIRAKHPEAVLLVAGHGPLEGKLRREAEGLGLGESIRFLGFRDDAAVITSLLDVSVLPSIGCDASSASIKEAMAVGTPIVATDVGGAREILKDGVTGLVVPPGDAPALAAAILSVVGDARRARTMGERAREDVRARFGPRILARAELAVYEKVLAARSHTHAPPAPSAARATGGRR